MRRDVALGGIGALAFGILTVVSLAVANPPGGTYSASESLKFLEKGHRVALFVALYLAMISVLGLICLLSYLRDAAIIGPDDRAARTFWAAGLAAAASFAIGWGITLGGGLAHAYGGHTLVTAPPVTYVLSEVGFVMIFAVGPILLGLALIALMIAVPAMFRGWLRWLTMVGGIAGVLSPVFFPFFILVLWAIVVGVWILAAGGAGEEAAPGPPRAAYSRS